MAHTTMASTGAKTWQAIKPIHESGPWYRSGDISEGLPMVSRIPTGGFYNGFGAILSHSYAQQFIQGPEASSIPGYWKGGGSAGGTVQGQAGRIEGYGGYGDLASDISSLTTKYNAEVASGQTVAAGITLTLLEAAKKKSKAEEGSTDWWNVLTSTLTAGTKIYEIEMARIEATRQRREDRRIRAAGGIPPYRPPIRTTGGGTVQVNPGMGTGAMVGIGVAVAAVAGLVLWKMA